MPINPNISFKQQIKVNGIRLLQERMDVAERAMREAQEAANREEKSSAGDKFETARAMAQSDKERNARQLEAARQQYMQLQTIVSDVIRDSMVPGAVARIGDAYYFLSVGLGSADVEGRKVWYLSAQAPLSNVLLHRKAGDTVVIQGKSCRIEEVF